LPAGRGGGYLDGGIGWYRKRFTLPELQPEQRVWIHFDGVYMDSSVWINGEPIACRPNGYISFGVDVTEHARVDGKDNVIAVRVNHQQPSSRWYSGSGIYRNVWLTILAPVHVADSGVFVHFGGFTRGSGPSPLPTAAEASVRTEVVNRSSRRTPPAP
jgi:beta-galactosidase